MKSINLTGNEWEMFLDMHQQTIEQLDGPDVVLDGLKKVTLVLTTPEGASFEFVGSLCRSFKEGAKPSELTEAAAVWLMDR